MAEGPSEDWLVTLPADECLSLLNDASIGRLAWVRDDGRITVIPVNYAVDAQSVVFRTSEGIARELSVASPVPAFQVDEMEQALHVGWSVLVHGDLERLRATDEVERLDALVKPWTGEDLPAMLRLVPQRITGRQIRVHPGGVFIVHPERPDT